MLSGYSAYAQSYNAERTALTNFLVRYRDYREYQGKFCRLCQTTGDADQFSGNRHWLAGIHVFQETGY